MRYGIRRPSTITGLPVPGGAVVLAPAADDVEALQGKARRVDLGDGKPRTMAVCAVLGQLLADRRGAANVRLDGRHVRRAAGAAACPGCGPAPRPRA